MNDHSAGSIDYIGTDLTLGYFSWELASRKWLNCSVDVVLSHTNTAIGVVREGFSMALTLGGGSKWWLT